MFPNYAQLLILTPFWWVFFFKLLFFAWLPEVSSHLYVTYYSSKSQGEPMQITKTFFMHSSLFWVFCCINSSVLTYLPLYSALSFQLSKTAINFFSLLSLYQDLVNISRQKVKLVLRLRASCFLYLLSTKTCLSYGCYDFRDAQSNGQYSALSLWNAPSFFEHVFQLSWQSLTLLRLLITFSFILSCRILL